MPGVSILVFEGPAGAGKTTAVQKILEHHPDYKRGTMPLFPRPRRYTGTDLAYPFLQYVTDTVIGLTELHATGGTLVMDRYIVSSFVYSCLDLGTPPSVGLLGKFFTTVARGILAGLDDVQLRGIQPASIQQLEYVFLLPELDKLNEQRERETLATARQYPYDAARERELFAWCAEHLGDVFHERIRGVHKNVFRTVRVRVQQNAE